HPAGRRRGSRRALSERECRRKNAKEEQSHTRPPPMLSDPPPSAESYQRCSLPVASCQLPVASCRLPVGNGQLAVADLAFGNSTLSAFGIRHLALTHVTSLGPPEHRPDQSADHP